MVFVSRNFPWYYRPKSDQRLIGDWWISFSAPRVVSSAFLEYSINDSFPVAFVTHITHLKNFPSAQLYMYDHKEATWHPSAATNYFFKKYINFLAIPYKSSCSGGIFAIFTAIPCTILSSCLSLALSPSSCIGTIVRLSPRSSWFWLLYHSNVMINITAIILTGDKTCQTSA